MPEARDSEESKPLRYERLDTGRVKIISDHKEVVARVVLVKTANAKGRGKKEQVLRPVPAG